MELLSVLIALALLQFGQHSPFLSLFERNRWSMTLPYFTKKVNSLKKINLSFGLITLIIAFGLYIVIHVLLAIFAHGLFWLIGLLLAITVVYLSFEPCKGDIVSLAENVLAPALWTVIFGVPGAVVFCAISVAREEEWANILYHLIMYPVSKLMLLLFAVAGQFSMRHLMSAATWKTLSYKEVLENAVQDNFSRELNNKPLKTLYARLIITWGVFLFLLYFVCIE